MQDKTAAKRSCD